MSDDVFARMDVADYHALILATFKAKDMEGSSSALRMMALYHPREAEELIVLLKYVWDAS